METIRVEESPGRSASPLQKVLASFSLEQYAPKLQDLGFSNGLHVLAKVSLENISDLCVRLQMTQEDALKFAKLTELLRVVLPGQALVHRRTNSSHKQSPVARQRHRRNNSFGYIQNNAKVSEKVYELIEKYQAKIENEQKQREERVELMRDFEEKSKTISLLTRELEKQRDCARPEEEKVGSEPPPQSTYARKEVGVSYDSSKLRSSLSHIDIEEMCRCLAKAISEHVKHSLAIKSSRESLDFSNPVPLLPDFFGDSTSVQCLDTGLTIPRQFIEVFEKEFNEPSAQGRLPRETDIYYFVKNIIFRAKMEKECSIICLIYMERLAKRTGLVVNERNWKKLAFIALVLASKVWDDESYENIHFSKVFSRYSLKEINSLERTFLTLVDYDVGIKKSEYARYYFVLRIYAGKSTRSFPLKALDVDTVRKLQSNAYRAETQLRSTQAEALYKSI